MACSARDVSRPNKLPGGGGIYFVSQMAIGARYSEVSPFEGERRLLMVGYGVRSGRKALDVVAPLAFVSTCRFVELAGVGVRVTIRAFIEPRNAESKSPAYVSLLWVLLMALDAFDLCMLTEKWIQGL